MAAQITAFGGTMPSRTQDTATFNTNVNAWFNYLTGTHKTDINALSSEVETNAVIASTKATEAATSATAAASSATEATTNGAAQVTLATAQADRAQGYADDIAAAVNFQGEWGSLTGALNTPATVYHGSYYWVLLNNIADVTASEPGVSADWEIVAGSWVAGDVKYSSDASRHPAPSWLQCNGDIFSSATYASLAAVLPKVFRDVCTIDSLPTANAACVNFDDTSTYLATCYSTSFRVYKRASDAYTAIQTTAPGGSNVNAVSFSQSADYLAVGTTNTPFAYIYSRAGDVFSNVTTPFDTAPSTSVSNIAFSPGGSYLAMRHTSGTSLTIYKRTGSAFAKLTIPSIPGTANSLAWSSDSTFLAVGHNVSPYITIFERSADTFTKVSDPATLPATAATVLSFSNDTNTLFVANGSTLSSYARSGTTFTINTAPSTMPSGTVSGINPSDDDSRLFVSDQGGTVSVYDFDGSTLSKAGEVRDTGAGSNINFSAIDATGIYFALAKNSTDFLQILKSENATPYLNSDFSEGEVKAYIKTGL